MKSLDISAQALYRQSFVLACKLVLKDWSITSCWNGFRNFWRENCDSLTYINWDVDRIVINDVEDFWANSRIHSYDGNVETGPVLKLHDCDRSSAYDLAQKFIDNGLKFLAVDTGNDEDKFEVYFEAIYPWGCLVEEQIFFSSRQKMFNSQFDRRKGGVRRILPWSAFRMKKARDFSNNATISNSCLAAMFEIHGENRGCIPPQDGQVSQTAGQTWPTIISPIRFRISLARDRYSLRWRSNVVWWTMGF